MINSSQLRLPVILTQIESDVWYLIKLRVAGAGIKYYILIIFVRQIKN